MIRSSDHSRSSHGDSKNDEHNNQNNNTNGYPAIHPEHFVYQKSIDINIDKDKESYRRKSIKQQSSCISSTQKFNQIIDRIWNYRKLIIVEPIIFFRQFPLSFLDIAIQNLGLEKACRINLGFSEQICKIMLKKQNFNIDCNDFQNVDDQYVESNFNIFINSTFSILENLNKTLLNINSSPLDGEFVYTTSELRDIVCTAELDSQKAVSFISGIRKPIASIIPIILILFAGGWSDKKNLRKPCILFPMIGEALMVTALLFSSLYFEEVPMEFGNIAIKVLPSVFGGQTLMIMGIYSYLTAITEAEDRSLRFGIFAIFSTIIPIVGTPLGGVFYEQLGYVNIFILGDIFLIMGIIYLIFFIKEVKRKDKFPEKHISTIGCEDNLGYDGPITDLAKNRDQIKTNGINQISINTKSSTIPKKPSNFCTEFFDLSLAVACIRVFTKPRKNNGRMFLLILIFTYAIFIGSSLAESDYLYQFFLVNLSLTPNQYSWYSTYTTVITAAGTFLITGVFSKLFKCSNPLIGIIATLSTIIARPMFAFAKKIIWLYAGATADLFSSCNAIAIRTIVSSIVDVEELGRLYSVLGIVISIGDFIFPPIYSAFYLATVDNFPGAFHLLSEVFFIPTAILFTIIYFYTKKIKKINYLNDQTKEPSHPSIEIGTYTRIDMTYSYII